MKLRRQYDIVVVGGGPAGSYTAKVAAERGVSVLVVEKDREIGFPVRCAEGVSASGIHEFFHDVDSRWEANQVDGYTLCSPDGNRVDVVIDDFGYVLNRRLFDRDLAKMASDAGAQVVTKTMAVGLSYENHMVRAFLDCPDGRTEVEAQLIVGADGLESRVGRWAGLRTWCRPHDMEICAQYTMTHLEIDPTRCEMHFGSKTAPGGYLWIFPKGEGVANVGLGISGDYSEEHTPFDYLDRFVEHRFSKASILNAVSGGVPCSGGVRNIVTDRVMLVGDAGHQANPMSGGGINNALRAASIAGRVAAEAVLEGDTSAQRLRPYEREWRKRYGNGHRGYYRLKETALGLSDEVLNASAEAANRLDPEERTLPRILRIAMFNYPRLLIDIARLFLARSFRLADE